MMRVHGMKVICLTAGGLTNVFEYTDNNCCEKSAEAIVDESYELYEVKKKNTEASQFIEGLNLAVG